MKDIGNIIVIPQEGRGGLQTVGGEEYVRVIDLFLSGCSRLHESSRKTYRSVMMVFYDWVLSTGHTFANLRTFDLKAFVSFQEKKGLKAKTRKLYVIVLRRFYGWAEQEGLYPDVARTLELPSDKRRDEFIKLPLTEAEIGRLISVSGDLTSKKMNRNYNHDLALRDKALLLLLVFGGLRTIEVRRADVGDIRIDEETGNTVIWLQRKGYDDKNMPVVLIDAVTNAIHDYLSTRVDGSDPAAPLFTSNGYGEGHIGGRISTRTVQRVAKEALRLIGLDSHFYSPHSLRHTTATQLLLHDTPIDQIQQVMGHKSSATTLMYLKTKIKQEHIRKAPEKVLANIKIN